MVVQQQQQQQQQQREQAAGKRSKFAKLEEEAIEEDGTGEREELIRERLQLID
ncbi:hypothetical protein AOL_s00006g125 [Orbilia oligospora ATCC 24927]|uniref:Uncharacterized protein n=1 Tax=Arthrobotrys oligospora (strain ATCC 24927 / CBS 115.81 / DSM 1491) TaxID=756982 RepID=G1WZS4_ARTOA|nr:hypothetical protein AOL_s00006g125 [Orbilia oligospora ATCC 24927]EGX53259.1 hypothetical protein AOL_s00006g125 [Orbilia oligospora ATCC 24927]